MGVCSRCHEKYMRVVDERDKARADYRFMVERAADEKLDGYRELAARAAAAENERDDLRRVVDEFRTVDIPAHVAEIDRLRGALEASTQAGERAFAAVKELRARMLTLEPELREELRAEKAAHAAHHASENELQEQDAKMATNFERLLMEARCETQVWKDRAEGRLARIEALEPGLDALRSFCASDEEADDVVESLAALLRARDAAAEQRGWDAAVEELRGYEPVGRSISHAADWLAARRPGGA